MFEVSSTIKEARAPPGARNVIPSTCPRLGDYTRFFLFFTYRQIYCWKSGCRFLSKSRLSDTTVELYIRYKEFVLEVSSEKRNVIGYEGTIALTTLPMHSTTCHTLLLAFCATGLIKTIGSRSPS